VSPSLWDDDELIVGYVTERYELVDLSGPHSVALVVGNSGSLTTGDTWLSDRLGAMFDTVTVFDDSTAEGSISAGTYDAIVIADSVTAATVGTKWKSFTGSVAVLNAALWDAQGLVDGSATESTTTTFAVETSPPAWLSMSVGEYPVDPDAASVAIGLAQWQPGLGQLIFGDADIVALWDASGSSFATLWTVEDGDDLSDFTVAAGRRAAWGGTEESLADPSTAWTTLFQDLMTWLVPSTFVQQVVSTPAASNAWQALLELSDWVGSSWAGENTGLRHYVNAPIPGTSRVIEDTVAFRGVQWRLDADTVDIEFVTSTIAQFLDQFILDDDVQGILDAGHRVS
jgi:hypothetical protein